MIFLKDSLVILPIILMLAAAGGEIEIARSQTVTTFDFGVTNRSGVPKDPRVIKEGPHPCGSYVTAKVDKMPRLGDRRSYLIPDLVVEIDARNRSIRRWAIPLEAQILGVSDARLLVKAADKTYWFYTSGAFQLQPKQLALQPSISQSKVKSHPEFPNSGYLQTVGYRDLKTGKIRRFLYEAPCT